MRAHNFRYCLLAPCCWHDRFMCASIRQSKQRATSLLTSIAVVWVIECDHKVLIFCMPSQWHCDQVVHCPGCHANGAFFLLSLEIPEMNAILVNCNPLWINEQSRGSPGMEVPGFFQGTYSKQPAIVCSHECVWGQVLGVSICSALYQCHECVVCSLEEGCLEEGLWVAQVPTRRRCSSAFRSVFKAFH